MDTRRFELESDYFLQILDTIDSGVHIADHQGNTLWINKTVEKMMGINRKDVIGINVAEQEQNGIYSPSVIRRALEQKKTITLVQRMQNGKKYMSSAHILYNRKNEPHYVIAHGPDFNKILVEGSQVEIDEIRLLLERYIREMRRAKVKQSYLFREEHVFIGKSKAFDTLTEFIEKVADVETTVLIIGETGVGKNVVAEKIHQTSERQENPFIHINCAAIPEALLESELFGYQKGAFTGANNSGKLGLVKMAENGTLFLDEVSELPLPLQSKLLQLLQNKTYLPIGASETVKANVRIIAATNQDLEMLVDQGKFRTDLFYRLNVLPINIPPLRERQDDIFPLLCFYLQNFNSKYNRNRKLSNEAIQALQQYRWPGNIRELENVLEQLVIMSKKDEITLADLPQRYRVLAEKEVHNFSVSQTACLKKTLQDIEREIINQSYQEHKTTRKTAKALGITQSSLIRRLAKYNMDATRS
ncbi:sigma-54 interaction domain-containing protein [Brevibacillus sp. NRS-1366]|uniref:sigma-54 interaction domain-containing protein n=1 Tax=Brevibacillus sp. NRS-1366 TaxID=3233899 RepID=UPI003D1E6303